MLFPLLNDPQFMIPFRLKFVQAVHSSDSEFDMPAHPALIMLLRILELNLLDAYKRRRTLYRSYYLASLFIWLFFDDWHWVLRTLMVIATGAAIFLVPTNIAPVRFVRQLLGAAVADISAAREEARVEAVFVGVLAISFGFWLGRAYYLLVFLQLLPLGMCEIERSLGSDVDKKSLSVARACCSHLATGFLLYLLFGRSWFAALLAVIVIYPSVTQYAMSGIGIGGALAAQGAVMVRPYLGALDVQSRHLARLGVVSHLIGAACALYASASLYFLIAGAPDSSFLWTAFLAVACACSLFPVSWLHGAQAVLAVFHVSAPLVCDPVAALPLAASGVLIGGSLAVAIVMSLLGLRKRKSGEGDGEHDANEEESESR